MGNKNLIVLKNDINEVEDMARARNMSQPDIRVEKKDKIVGLSPGFKDLINLGDSGLFNALFSECELFKDLSEEESKDHEPDGDAKNLLGGGDDKRYKRSKDIVTIPEPTKTVEAIVYCGEDQTSLVLEDYPKNIEDCVALIETATSTLDALRRAQEFIKDGIRLGYIVAPNIDKKGEEAIEIIDKAVEKVDYWW